MFKKIISLLLVTVFTLTFAIPVFAEKDKEITTIDEIVLSFENPNGRVLCVAKYGNPRLFPENSLEGISSAATLGADIVSICAQQTKDRQLILLSSDDLSIWCVNKGDNTTAKGKVSDYTLAELKDKFLLKEGSGGVDAKPTKYSICSLAEAIETSTKNVMLLVTNGWKYREAINAVARNYDACNKIIIGGATDSADIQLFINQTDTPICHISATYTTSMKEPVKKFVPSTLKSGAKMVKLQSEKSYSSIFNSSVLSKFDDIGRAFISTTSPSQCGGKDDLIATWDDLIVRGYSVIETDYPKEFAKYIETVESYRTDLTTLITQAKAINTSKYTKESNTALNDSLKEAERIAATGCISLHQIDKARYDIQESLDSLTVKTGDEKTGLSIWAKLGLFIISLFLILILIVLGLRFYNKRRRQKSIWIDSKRNLLM
ncbi:MAG: hypothetical protein GX241_01540 [Ruminococcaceae bacterium]|nr:hypothetical protein [Oscillospiraceae bacterium]